MKLTIEIEITSKNREFVFGQLAAISEYLQTASENEADKPRINLYEDTPIEKQIESKVTEKKTNKKTGRPKKTNKKPGRPKKANNTESIKDLAETIIEPLNEEIDFDIDSSTAETHHKSIVDSFDLDFDSDDLEQSEPQKNYNIDDIKDLVVPYCKQFTRGKELVKRILNKFDADSLKNLKEEDYNSFYKTVKYEIGS